jgi:cyclopropane-fatty-acyl-phospholipid synthase
MLMSAATAPETAFFDLLDRAVTSARLRFVLPDRTLTVGRGGAPDGPADATVRVTDLALFGRVLAEGNLGLAETYMSGGFTVEEGSLEGLLTILAASRLDEVRLDPRAALRLGVLRAQQLLRGTRANVQAHYDLGEDLYDTFLDPTRGYSCGYQKGPDDTLEALQENKYERICQKLRLREGETLFDVGCGYGGLMIHAAQRHGVRARGITNSQAHGAFVARRVRELGLEGRVTVELGDLREARGVHDKVVSVGVFEHLGRHEQRGFFQTFSRLLSPGGFGLLHTIGCVTAKNVHDPFIQKYVFPGSTQNPLSVLAAAMERQRLAVLDVENVARHYAPTARAWLARFRANRHTLDPVRYDAAFLRMWEYYLALCVAGASATDGAVWQLLVTPDYRRPLPMIRV